MQYDYCVFIIESLMMPNYDKVNMNVSTRKKKNIYNTFAFLLFQSEVHGTETCRTEKPPAITTFTEIRKYRRCALPEGSPFSSIAAVDPDSLTRTPTDPDSLT